MPLEVLLLGHGYEVCMEYLCSFWQCRCMKMDLLCTVMKITGHGLLGRMFGVPLLEIAGGRPSSRGGARVLSPYPLSISQSHIQIYILTLHLLPQHSSSSDVRTSRATLRLVRFFPCAISSSTCRDPIPNVSFRSQASYSTLVHLLTPYMQFN